MNALRLSLLLVGLYRVEVTQLMDIHRWLAFSLEDDVSDRRFQRDNEYI